MPVVQLKPRSKDSPWGLRTLLYGAAQEDEPLEYDASRVEKRMNVLELQTAIMHAQNTLVGIEAEQARAQHEFEDRIADQRQRIAAMQSIWADVSKDLGLKVEVV
jgi:hypothetical protein